MPTLGPWELIVILLIVVIIFGAGRLSQIGGAVGKSVREFRTAVKDDTATDTSAPVAASATATAAPVAEVTCPSCGSANTSNQKFCSKCGTKLGPVAATSATAPAENTCPSCATVNPAGQVFCGQCGTRLTRAA